MTKPTPSSKKTPDFLWLHLRDLPYFRGLIRAVESAFYQDYQLAEPTLDIGCGDGHFASITFKQPLDVGIDPWAGPIREAYRRGCYRLLVQGDGAKMPFPDGFFASGISNSVLEHIPHIDAVLAETGRVFRPGAMFLFCVPNPRYLSELVLPQVLRRAGLIQLGENYRSWFKRVTRVHHLDDASIWAERLDRAGFVLEKSWDYFSPEALRTLELGHYLGAPTLLPHFLFRRWILVPARWNLALTMQWVRKYAVAEPHPEGTFTFFQARKAG
jgi:SAM-dependent methyltransferase